MLIQFSRGGVFTSSVIWNIVVTVHFRLDIFNGFVYRFLCSRFLGVFMLVFGFVSLVVGLVFCAWMCREGSPDAPVPPSQFYWTHRWRKTIHLPESHGRIHETTVKTPIDDIHYLDESDSYHNGSRYHTNRY